MSEPDPGRDFTAGEVRAAAGLSYRQLHDWDGRGALPSGQRRWGGWRRFNINEVFALAACSELRRRFGIPVSRLRRVREYLSDPEANHFGRAMKYMAALKVGVWLVTNLDDLVVLDADIELQELAEAGYFNTAEGAAYVSLRVNPLVNRILGCLKKPIHLPSDSRTHERLAEARAALRARTPEEQAFLHHVRSGNCDAVEAVMKDGQVRTIKVTRRVPEPAVKAVEELLREHDYQSLHLVQKDGKTVAIEQVATLKPREKQS